MDHSGGPIYTLARQKEPWNRAANRDEVQAQYQNLQLVWEEALFICHPDGERLEPWHEELRGWETLLAGLELEDLLRTNAP